MTNTNEELALSRERAYHLTWRIGIIAGLLALLAVLAALAHGCRQEQRCPAGMDLRATCGVPASPDCIAAMRKACK